MSARLRLALLLAALPGSDCAWADPAIEGGIREENLSFPYISDAGAFEWSARFHHGGAHFIRVHLRVGAVVPVAPFRVVIAGRDGVAQSFTEATLPAGREFWTRLIPGDEATVKVVGQPPGLRLTVVRVAYQVDPFRRLSLIGDDDREEFWKVANDNPSLAAAGKAVAKLSIITSSGLPAACTGFMVSSDLLLTNQHCIAEKADCESTMVVFGYQRDDTGAVRFGQQVECADLLDNDPDLDFALVRLAGAPGAPGSWGSLAVSSAGVATGNVSMIQHPGGFPKRIAFPPHCKVLTLKAEGRNADKQVDLTHDCDCEEGSSGSPVLNAALEVVALHRRGKTAVGPYSDRNRAVRIQEICPRIKLFLPSLVCAPLPGPPG